MTPTLLIALWGAALGTYGALLSTFSFVENRRRNKLDRADLAITWRIADELLPAKRAEIEAQLGFYGRSAPAPKMCIWLDLVNRGHRVLRLHRLIATLRGGEEKDFREASFPPALDEKERHSIQLPLEFLSEASSVAGLRFVDSTGVPWPFAHVDFLRLQTAARGALAERIERERPAREKEAELNAEDAKVWAESGRRS